MEINIDDPKIKFQEHINQTNNDRILFSGKFGTGKSYFLKKYFEDFKDDYNVFWISPINYVVGNNQDIFEWIKIDIAQQLLRNYIPLNEKEERFSNDFILQNFVYQKSWKILNKLLLYSVDKIQQIKTKTSFLDLFKKEFDEYEEFKKATNSNKSDTQELIENVFSATNTLGSIFEDNIITKIIRANVELLNTESKKQSVLIIDDLDRLDPEHIFRILNILSCHNDHFDSNKFGFNKTILVCDYANIETVYKHRYGPSAEFDGYIAKFYSFEPFYYSIKDAIKSFCRNRIEMGFSNSSLNVLSYLIILLVKENLITVRNLKKIFTNSEVNILNFGKLTYNLKKHSNLQIPFINTEVIEVDFNQFPILKIINILANALGGIDLLKTAFTELKDTNYAVECAEDLIIEIGIPLTLFRQGNNFSSAFYTFITQGPTEKPTWPVTQAFDSSNEIILEWNMQNKYTAGHYFKNATVKTNINQMFSDAILIREFLTLVDFLISANIITNIKLRK